MKNLITSTLIIFLTILTSCSSDEETTPKPTATLSSISPNSGPKASLVTISGTNFGNNMDNITVYFNNLEAIVQAVTDTEITAQVPARAYTGLVKVRVNGTELIGPEFNYIISDIQVSTLAGSTYGYADGPGSNAQFAYIEGITVDTQGNLFVTDLFNHKIRKITPDGMVSTVAGSNQGFSNGTTANAQFDSPMGITIDNQGNLYVADTGNSKIRKITPNGMVSTFAGSIFGDVDGMGTAAQLTYPRALTSDQLGNLYVTESASGVHKIRKITPNGMVSTLAGSTEGDADGVGSVAHFEDPRGITVDNQGNLYVADNGNDRIRKITPSGMVSTFAGSSYGDTDGMGTAAQFNQPTGITIDNYGNLYVADNNNEKIRKIVPSGMVITIAGSTRGYTDGTGVNAQFYKPYSIIVDSQANLFVSDSENHKIRKITQE